MELDGRRVGEHIDGRRRGKAGDGERAGEMSFLEQKFTALVSCLDLS